MFEFELKKIDESKVEEVTDILEKYLELKSRKRNSKMWQGVDKLESVEEKDKESHYNKTKWVSRIYLIAGLIIYTLGTNADNLVLKIIGGAILALAIFTTLGSNSSRKLRSKLSLSAKNLIDQRNMAANNNEVYKKILFNNNGLVDLNGKVINSFSSYNNAIISDSFITLSDDNNMNLIQKEELVDGDLNDFIQSISNSLGVVKL